METCPDPYADAIGSSGRRCLWTRHLVLWALAVMLAIGALVQAGSLINHDVGSHLTLAGRLLRGGDFYDQVLDPNPPLIFWLLTIPNLIAHVSGLDLVLVFRVLVFSLMLASLLLVDAVTRQRLSSDPLTASVITLSLAAGLVLLVGPHFGQREHLMMILSAPYLVTTATRGSAPATDSCLRFALGIAAGLGFALKPQFLVVPAAVEWASARDRSQPDPRWPAESVGLLAVLALYGVALVTIGRRYTLEIAPLVPLVYGAYDAPMLQVVISMASDAVLLTAAAALADRSFWPASVSVFLMFGLATAVLHPLAGKGWSYHAYPLSVGALLCGVLALRGLSRRLAASARATPAGLILAGTVLGLLGWKTYDAVAVSMAMVQETEVRTTVRELADLIETHGSKSPICALSTDVSPTFPSVNYTSAVWASRFNCLWVLPAIANAPRAERHGDARDARRLRAVEVALLDAVFEDLSRSKPLLILVDDRPTKQGIREQKFDMIRYFSADPRIAPLIRDYEQVGSAGGMRLMRRRTGETTKARPKSVDSVR